MPKYRPALLALMLGSASIAVTFLCWRVLGTDTTELTTTAEGTLEARMRAGQSLGIVPETTALSDLVVDGAGGIPQFRERMCAKGVPSYLPVFGDQVPTEAFADRAAKMLQGTWDDGGRPFPIAAPINWEADPFGSRLWKYNLNAWRPLHPVMSVWQARRASDPAYAARLEDVALGFALDWADSNFFRGEDYRSGGRSFVWYDMAAGLRAAMMGQLLPMAACDQEVSDEGYLILLRSAADHLAYLGADRFHVAHNNHGIYQSTGVLVLCDRVPEMKLCPPATHIAQERLLKAFAGSFSTEGVHQEHSTGYHLYMLEVLRPVIEAGGFSAAATIKLEKLYSQAQEALAWFIKPRGKLTQFGDTDETFVTEQTIRLILGEQRPMHPLLAWTLARGTAERPYPEDHRLFPDAGYAVYRQERGTDGRFETASYLAVAAAFHSRVHKHVDELSIEWSDLGHDILVEPGRFAYEGKVAPASDLGKLGFRYSHPSRIYVESPHAHNTVEIDGTPDMRRFVKPYGSGLKGGGNTPQGWFYADAVVVLKKSVEHRRVVVLNPNKWLLVYDRLAPAKGVAPREHTFTQWLHLNPAARLTGQGPEQVHFSLDGQAIMVHSLAPNATLAVHKGETEPRLQGWHSDKPNELVPNYAVGVTKKGAVAAIATLINLIGRGLVGGSFDPQPAGGLFKATWTYEDGETAEVDAVVVDGKLVIR